MTPLRLRITLIAGLELKVDPAGDVLHTIGQHPTFISGTTIYFQRGPFLKTLHHHVACSLSLEIGTTEDATEAIAIKVGADLPATRCFGHQKEKNNAHIRGCDTATQWISGNPEQ